MQQDETAAASVPAAAQVVLQQLRAAPFLDASFDTAVDKIHEVTGMADERASCPAQGRGREKAKAHHHHHHHHHHHGQDEGNSEPGKSRAAPLSPKKKNSKFRRAVQSFIVDLSNPDEYEGKPRVITDALAKANADAPLTHRIVIRLGAFCYSGEQVFVTDREVRLLGAGMRSTTIEGDAGGDEGRRTARITDKESCTAQTGVDTVQAGPFSDLTLQDLTVRQVGPCPACAVNVAAGKVALHGCTLTGESEVQPVLLVWRGGDCTAESCVIERGGFTGVEVADRGSSLLMTDTTVSEHRMRGVDAYDGGVAILEGCTVSKCMDVGVNVFCSLPTLAAHATLTGCTISDNKQCGVAVKDRTASAVLKSCTITANAWEGALFYREARGTVGQCTFASNGLLPQLSVARESRGFVECKGNRAKVARGRGTVENLADVEIMSPRHEINGDAGVARGSPTSATGSPSYSVGPLTARKRDAVAT